MTVVAAGGVQAQPKGLITREAKQSLAAYQFHAMKIDTDGLIDVVDTGSAGPVMGLLQNAPAAGAEAEIATKGTSLAVLGGTVDEGAKLGSDSNYHLVTVTSDTSIYFAIAMEGGDSGELIEVKLLGEQNISTT